MRLMTMDEYILLNQPRPLWLPHIDLEQTNLMGAHFEGAYLTGARLGGAYLMMTNLAGANLWSANLEGADLRICQPRRGGP